MLYIRDMTSNYSGFCTVCHKSYEAGTNISRNALGNWVHTVCPKANNAFVCDACGSTRCSPGFCTTYDTVDGLRPAPFNQATQRDVDDDSFDAWVAFQASKPRPQISVDEAGVYVLSNGDIVKVQANREKTRTYAKRLVEIGGVRLTEAGERVNAEYQYEPGLIQQVAAQGRKMTLEEAKTFILRYGFCARCARQLKDATSVERGIGPVCIQYFSEGTTAAELTAAAPAAEAPARMVPADDDEENPIPLPLPADLRSRQVENWLAAKRSRWSRPDDDELESAAY